MAQNLPQLPPWEQVSTNVIRILGGNPGKFTLQGTNTYLLGRGPRRLLVDTGQGEQVWADTLRSVLQQQSPPATVAACLLTHWHHDHIGGVKDLDALSAETRSSSPGERVPVYKNQPTLDPDGLLDTDRLLEIVDGQRFRVSSAPSTSGGAGGDQNVTEGEETFEIEAIHTPGHAKDHISFLVTQSSDPDEVGAIFTADNVLGHGTAVFEDLSAYLDSLALMKRRVAESIVAQDGGSGASEGASNNKIKINVNNNIKKRRAFPGHGAVIDDAVAKIDEYITHRRLREEEALNVLRFGTTTRPDATGGELVHDSITTYEDDGDGGEGEAASETRHASAAGAGLGLGKEITSGKEWSSIELVKVIYRHYPESLYQPAEYGLLRVLEKLRLDGKVVKTPEGKWRISEKATL
ncbi:hypothetical protein A1O3_03076 [Capronia epimyces CBS 606.96]|uniref:Metallo-beta-lactamase domain-containing protein n=1 Tax=Capronia epimyces CBS 606.96 TaxID=1182542 RepID=W9YBX0_9EURO|nr:uncharacterized protein A1O3_03076 [Capronia epimyces CBS 606.96]EXJ90008.1 hypothetical protein A1O3_03076 [Capronia epimyces CBS 606.96]